MIAAFGSQPSCYFRHFKNAVIYKATWRGKMRAQYNKTASVFSRRDHADSLKRKGMRLQGLLTYKDSADRQGRLSEETRR